MGTKNEINAYENLENNLISTFFWQFDFDREIYPSWFPKRKHDRSCCWTHMHEKIEVLAVEEGELLFYVSGVPYHLKEGNLLLINPFEPHSGSIPESCQRAAYRGVQLDIGMLRGISYSQLQTLTERLMSGMWFYPNLPTKGKEKQLHKLILSLFHDQKTLQDELMLLSDALRFLAVLGSPQLGTHELQNERSREFIQKTILYIQGRNMEHLTLSEVAKKFSYNKAYFSTLFKQHFRMTFTEFCLRYKIENAKECIRGGCYHLTEVCSRSGFHHYTYFYRKFKELSGVTPSEYVEQCKRDYQSQV